MSMRAVVEEFLESEEDDAVPEPQEAPEFQEEQRPADSHDQAQKSEPE
jgi:hypothetical protein